VLTLQDMLFTDEDLQTMFGMFDIVRKGTITADQYKQGAVTAQHFRRRNRFCEGVVDSGAAGSPLTRLPPCSDVDAWSGQPGRPGWGNRHV
jgi:hypothetical protein